MKRLTRSAAMNNDPIEGMLEEITDIFRRAIDLGRRIEKEEVRARMLKAIGEPEPASTVTGIGEQVAKNNGKAVAPPTYPYGHISMTVRKILLANRLGISRADITRISSGQFNTPISMGAALTALKSLKKAELARFKGGPSKKWIATAKLILEEETQDAPEPEAQGRLITG
jgi:hypothetical protein